ncbi:glycosyltransferase [Mycolicibacterium mengxianglii]|uniref:glycosyltransferase n=1 Tax=Mycolicibacterium mengxianglii TaxID=2736649 RepID=UPI0018D10A2A|nr:glycosyltransferase [Mycolicibacterium mengxianglii]
MISNSKVAVAVSTFRRPAELRKLLGSLKVASLNGAEIHVIVADNDPQASAKEICAGHDLEIDYIHEPRPGIVHCRNAALSRVTADCDYVAIVDDDEWVEAGWLDRLLETMESLPGPRVDVVGGPVVSVFPPDAPKWVVRGGFHQRPRRVTGEAIPLAATNNVLVRLDALANLEDPTFSQEFAETGGSDSDLFWRMRREGARLVWCDEAVVTEEVPIERCTAKWIRRRAIRLGNVHGRLELREKKRWVVVAGGIARVGYGFFILVMALLIRRRCTSRAITTMGRGVGMVGAAFNSFVREYKR